MINRDASKASRAILDPHIMDGLRSPHNRASFCPERKHLICWQATQAFRCTGPNSDSA